MKCISKTGGLTVQGVECLNVLLQVQKMNAFVQAQKLNRLVLSGGKTIIFVYIHVSTEESLG